MIGFGIGSAALVRAAPEAMVFHGEEQLIPRRICRVCDAPSTMAMEYESAGGLTVCSDCATIIANVFSHVHSGRYLTWPNEALDRAVGYRKKNIPEALRWEVFERDGFACVRCGARRMLRADHKHPESAGGEATLENLQTLCHGCNSRKGARVGKA